jgi:hypothetical protein
MEKFVLKVEHESAQKILKDARKNLRAIGYAGALAPLK